MSIIVQGSYEVSSLKLAMTIGADDVVRFKRFISCRRLDDFGVSASVVPLVSGGCGNLSKTLQHK